MFNLLVLQSEVSALKLYRTLLPTRYSTYALCSIPNSWLYSSPVTILRLFPSGRKSKKCFTFWKAIRIVLFDMTQTLHSVSATHSTLSAGKQGRYTPVRWTVQSYIPNFCNELTKERKNVLWHSQCDTLWIGNNVDTKWMNSERKMVEMYVLVGFFQIQILSMHFLLFLWP